MKSVVYILLILLILSCEKDILIENQIEFKPKLVLNAQIASDSFFSFGLSKTILPSADIEQSLLSGEAEVLLLKNSLPMVNQKFKIENGRVTVPRYAEAGSTYELQILYDGLPSVMATDSVPIHSPNIRVDSLRDGQEVINLDVAFEDSQEKEYYLLQAFASGKKIEGTDTTYVQKEMEFNSTDNIFISTFRDLIEKSSFALFNDELLFAKQNEFSISIAKDSLDSPQFIADGVSLQLSSISETMYTYYINLMENTHIYGGPLANIKDDYGNVNQGLGIFSFKNSSEVKVQIE